MSERERTSILWCSGSVGAGRDGWRFPRAVRREIMEFCGSMSVLHLFGGKADFGTRLDIDASTRPDVVGDAWLAPFIFGRDRFDVVVMDPPYTYLNTQMKQALFRNAGWVARRYLIWFHPVWVALDRTMPLERAWLVRVGRSAAIRCLQIFAVQSDKREPVRFFDRGPAMKYNKWLAGQEDLFSKEKRA